jgi:hypothetical protein
VILARDTLSPSASQTAALRLMTVSVGTVMMSRLESESR